MVGEEEEEFGRNGGRGGEGKGGGRGGMAVDRGGGVVVEGVECMRGGRERNNRRTMKWRGRLGRRRGGGRSGEDVEWCEKGVAGGGECGGHA